MPPSTHSDPDPSFRDQLAAHLENAASALCGEATSARPLRALQRSLAEWSGQVSGDSAIRSTAFFLELFINNVFYNLTGDVPVVAGVTRPIQVTFYQEVGTSLRDLATSIREQRLLESCSSFVHLGMSYLKAVDSLNERLSRAHA